MLCSDMAFTLNVEVEEGGNAHLIPYPILLNPVFWWSKTKDGSRVFSMTAGVERWSTSWKLNLSYFGRAFIGDGLGLAYAIGVEPCQFGGGWSGGRRGAGLGRRSERSGRMIKWMFLLLVAAWFGSPQGKACYIIQTHSGQQASNRMNFEPTFDNYN